MFEDLIPTNQFAFVHGTFPGAVNVILKDGYLRPSKVTGNEGYDVFDSVFMGFVSPNNKAPVDSLYNYELILILKPEIYKDYKHLCHFNTDWKYGKIDDKTTFYKDFPEYTEDENLQLNLNNLDIVMKDDKKAFRKKHKIGPNYDRTLNRNELVVKDSIPIDKYLIGIISGLKKNKLNSERLNNVKLNNPKYKDYWVNDNPELQKYVEKYMDFKKFKIN
jgi:hypothetical protein